MEERKKKRCGKEGQKYKEKGRGAKQRGSSSKERRKDDWIKNKMKERNNELKRTRRVYCSNKDGQREIKQA